MHKIKSVIGQNGMLMQLNMNEELQFLVLKVTENKKK
jgi:hypothetical protein